MKYEKIKNQENLENANKKFFNAWAWFYDYTPIKPWLFYIQKRIINNIELKDSQKILDIGCGTGDALIYLSKLLNKRKIKNVKLYGIDISINMLKIAGRKLRGKAALLPIRNEKTKFKNNNFDCIICTEAFHHFPNQEKALREIYRILKRKGILVIADISLYSGFIHKLFKILEPGHVKLYKKEEFRKLFEKNNFHVLKQERIGLFAVATTAIKI